MERVGFAFCIEIEYERLPEFCSAYHGIGHSISNCERRTSPDAMKGKPPNSKPNSTKIYVPIKEKQKQGETFETTPTRILEPL